MIVYPVYICLITRLSKLLSLRYMSMIKYAMNEVYIDMRVEIWSDFVSPLCYIAKRKFDLALSRFAQQQYVKVEYKSFLLHTNRRITAVEWQELLIETCNVPVNQIDQWMKQINEQAKE